MFEMRLPSSKSITNRDLILASLTDGISYLKGFSPSDDTEIMIEALRKLGIKIEENKGILTVYGGIKYIKGNGIELNLGNSGTSTRFLTAFAVLNSNGYIHISGDERMKKRPIEDLLDGISQLGIEVESDNGFFPVRIKGGKIKNNFVVMNGESSSQYFTALLQIAPLLEYGLEIEVIGEMVSKPYIDITINEMLKFGVKVENKNYKHFVVLSQKYFPVNIDIEGDASALSYLACYSAFHGKEIKFLNIGKNTKQGDYKFLEEIKIFGLNYSNDENSTTVFSKGLKNIDLQKYENSLVNFENMPDVSMSYMIMSIFLPGNTIISGLQTLNHKESDRIIAMKNELIKIGVNVSNDNDSITIGEYKGHTGLIDIETYNDHRIAMCFGILNTYIGNLNILNPSCVNKTYPNFWKDLEKLSNHNN